MKIINDKSIQKKLLNNRNKYLRYLMLYKKKKLLQFFLLNVPLMLLLILFCDIPIISRHFSILVLPDEVKVNYSIIYDFTLAILSGEIIWIITTYIPNEKLEFEIYQFMEEDLISLLIYILNMTQLLKTLLGNEESVCVNKLKLMLLKSVTLTKRKEMFSNEVIIDFLGIYNLELEKIEKKIEKRHYNFYTKDVIYLISEIRSINFDVSNEWIIVDKTQLTKYTNLYERTKEEFKILNLLSAEINLFTVEKNKSTAYSFWKLPPYYLESNMDYKYKVHSMAKIYEEGHFTKLFYETHPKNKFDLNLFLKYEDPENVTDYYNVCKSHVYYKKEEDNLVLFDSRVKWKVIYFPNKKAEEYRLKHHCQQPLESEGYQKIDTLTVDVFAEMIKPFLSPRK